MKTVISLSLSLLLGNCANTAHIGGLYASNTGGLSSVGLSLSEHPPDFEYHLRSELGLLEFAAGTWTREGDKLTLSGFNEGTIRLLSVGVEKRGNASGERSRIVVEYEKANKLAKADLLLNDTLAIPISGDTTLLPGISVQRIRVRSYLSYNGLLGTRPKIDTLYSAVISAENASGLTGDIVLKFRVGSEDFFRTMLKDTILTVKNNHTVLWGTTKLRKTSSK